MFFEDICPLLSRMCPLNTFPYKALVFFCFPCNHIMLGRFLQRRGAGIQSVVARLSAYLQAIIISEVHLFFPFIFRVFCFAHFCHYPVFCAMSSNPLTLLRPLRPRTVNEPPHAMGRGGGVSGRVLTKFPQEQNKHSETLLQGVESSQP